MAIHVQEVQFALEGRAGGVVDTANVNVFRVRSVAGHLFGIVLSITSAVGRSCETEIGEQHDDNKRNRENDKKCIPTGVVSSRLLVFLCLFVFWVAGLFFGFGIDGMFVHDDLPFFSAKCVDGTVSGQNKRNGLGMY